MTDMVVDDVTKQIVNGPMCKANIVDAPVIEEHITEPGTLNLGLLPAQPGGKRKSRRRR